MCGQNLYARAQQLVGDRDPRSHEFSVQLRALMRRSQVPRPELRRSRCPVQCLVEKSVRGGLVVVGEVTLGGTIEPIHNAVTLAEIAEKGLSPCCCQSPAAVSFLTLG